MRKRILDVFLFGTPILTHFLRFKFKWSSASQAFGTLGSSATFRYFSRGPTHCRLPVPIAMRMNWKSEENILSNQRRQVDQFGPGQLDLSRKVSNANREDEPLEATDALQADIHAEIFP